MIGTYLVLRPADDCLERLVDYYRRQGVIEAAVPYGLVLGELAHPSHGANTLAVGSLWTSSAAYDSWVAAPEREALIRGMAGFLDGREPPVGWATEATGVTGIDFTPVFGDQPATIRVRAGEPSFLSPHRR